jgi:hypothetical protein
VGKGQPNPRNGLLDEHASAAAYGTLLLWLSDIQSNRVSGAQPALMNISPLSDPRSQLLQRLEPDRAVFFPGTSPCAS